MSDLYGTAGSRCPDTNLTLERAAPLLSGRWKDELNFMSTQSAPVTERRFLVPFILITSLFFLWAFGVNLNDILIPHLKNLFGLSEFQSSLIQVAFFGGYFLAAFPACWAIERIGYRKGILAAL